MRWTFIQSIEQIKSIESFSNSINLSRDFRDCDISPNECAFSVCTDALVKVAPFNVNGGILFAMCFLTNVNVLSPFHRKYTNLIWDTIYRLFVRYICVFFFFSLLFFDCHSLHALFAAHSISRYLFDFFSRFDWAHHPYFSNSLFPVLSLFLYVTFVRSSSFHNQHVRYAYIMLHQYSVKEVKFISSVCNRI